MNIQPTESGIAAFDISTALIPGLIVSDRAVGDATEKVAGEMRVTTAPRHPGHDPVSTHIVEQLVSVLRGEGGLAPRLADITERLRTSADRLDASLRQYQATDQDTARAIRRTGLRP